MNSQTREDTLNRLKYGRQRYGVGIVVDKPNIHWMGLAKDEMIDALIYMAADYIDNGRLLPGSMSFLELQFTCPVSFMDCPDDKVDEWITKNRKKDDHALIMFVLDNFRRIESDKHFIMITQLNDILDFCL